MNKRERIPASSLTAPGGGSMPSATSMLADCIFAVTLVVLGVAGYFGTGRVSVTALIPAVFGLLVGAFALLAWSSPSWSGPLRYATVAVAILGFVATARSLPALSRALRRDASVSPAAISKGMMSVSCLTFVGVVVLGG